MSRCRIRCFSCLIVSSFSSNHSLYSGSDCGSYHRYHLERNILFLFPCRIQNLFVVSHRISVVETVGCACHPCLRRKCTSMSLNNIKTCLLSLLWLEHSLRIRRSKSSKSFLKVRISRCFLEAVIIQRLGISHMTNL